MRRRVGITELRQRAGEYLRLVEAGETVEVTDRGRPVALLTPLPGGHSGGREVTREQREAAYARLIREGVVIPATDPGSILDVEPLPADPSRPSMSQVLQAMRDEDDR